MDRQRLKNRSEDDDGIPDIDEGLKHRLDAARPAQLHIYCSHKGVMFKASISAADVASKLDNGARRLTAQLWRCVSWPPHSRETPPHAL